MTLYAESSALAAFLLSEQPAEPVIEALRSARLVFASRLTVVECSRALLRARLSGAMTPKQEAEQRRRLETMAIGWEILPLSAAICARARQPFPAEPVRTLDALHLASALAVQAADPSIALLSLDRRVREAARELGFHVLPATA